MKKFESPSTGQFAFNKIVWKEQNRIAIGDSFLPERLPEFGIYICSDQIVMSILPIDAKTKVNKKVHLKRVTPLSLTEMFRNCQIW